MGGFQLKQYQLGTSKILLYLVGCDVNGLPADTAMGLEQLWVWHVIACRESVRFSFGMLTRAGASSAAAVYRHRPFFLETMARVWHWYAWLPCFSPLVIGFFRT